MAFAAKILADSINTHDTRLITFEVTFPRCILAEFNTHRVLSRNSASSRAIPVEKQIAKVLADPFKSIDYEELMRSYDDIEIARICAARCARVSYLTHDGVRDPAEDLAMAERLKVPVLHASPFEHPAQAMSANKPSGNFTGGWGQFRKRLPGEAIFQGAR